MRFLATMLVLLAASTPGVAEPGPCLGDGASSQSALTRVVDAIRVLDACGHDPADYRVTLRQDDFAEPGVMSVVFLPVDDDSGYSVRVSDVNPCRLAWVASGRGFTPWQQRVIDAARRWMTGQAETLPVIQLSAVEITEDRGFVGVRIVSVRGADPTTLETRILVDKNDLTLVRAATGTDIDAAAPGSPPRPTIRDAR